MRIKEGQRQAQAAEWNKQREEAAMLREQIRREAEVEKQQVVQQQLTMREAWDKQCQEKKKQQFEEKIQNDSTTFLVPWENESSKDSGSVRCA